MVATQGHKLGKPTKSKKLGRQVSGGIRHNIPFDKRELVTRVEVSRKVGSRVLTKSTKVIVPAAPSGPSNPQDSSPLPPSDENTPSVPSKKARKGPSRSATVSFPPSQFSLTN